MHIVGRGGELEQVRAAVAAGRSLLLEGEPGAGKTTLWEEAVAAAEAEGRAVLRARPAEAEAALGFAVLGDLLAQVPREALAAVGGARARALERVLVLGDDEAPVEPRTLALALLELLDRLARGQPLALAVDDAQWVDRDSAAALHFALRRAQALPLLALVAQRSDSAAAFPVAEPCERLTVGPLSLGALRELLRERLGVVLPRRRLQQVAELSGGNPFFALELGRELGRDGDADALSLPATLEAAAAARLDDLTPEGEDALLVAALAASPPIEVAERVLGADQLAAGLRAGVVRRDRGRLAPAHPLLGAALLEQTPRARVRAAHARLAAAVPDRIRRARHAALATDRPDGGVAAELDAAVEASRGRGAAVDAAELALLALQRTPPDARSDRCRRRLRAGELLFLRGDADAAQELVAPTVEEFAPGDERAAALLLLAEVVSSNAATIEWAERALAEATAPALRARALLIVSLARAISLDCTDEAAAAARDAAEAAAEAGDAALQGMAATVRLLLAALRAEPEPQEPERRTWLVSLSTRRIRALTATWSGELDRARADLEALRAEAAGAGDDESVRVIALNLSELEARAGNATAAAAYARETAEVAVDRTTASTLRRLDALVLAATDPAAGLAAADESRRAAVESREWDEAEAQRLAGALALATGDPERAAAELAALDERLRANGIANPGVFPLGGDLVEALLALGDVEAADAAATRLEQAGEAGHAWAQAVGRRSRALLAATAGDGETARALLAMPVPPGLRLEQVRTLLALGTVERRARRWAPARAALAAACDEALALGQTWWAERAEAELARVGGRRPTAGELSESERRVAALVARGLTNQQVARELYVAVRTVESTLSRVYAKLGVRGRTQLARHPAVAGD